MKNMSVRTAGLIALLVAVLAVPVAVGFAQSDGDAQPAAEQPDPISEDSKAAAVETYERVMRGCEEGRASGEPVPVEICERVESGDFIGAQYADEEQP